MNMPWTGTSEIPIIADYLDFMEAQGGAGAAATVVVLIGLFYVIALAVAGVAILVGAFTDKENTE